MAQLWSGMRGISTVPTYVVMQPTTLCNLDCSYCYLPFRKVDRQMPVEVARAVAESVNPWSRTGRFSTHTIRGTQPTDPGAGGFSAASPSDARGNRGH